jgi:hypothetical protein
MMRSRRLWIGVAAVVIGTVAVMAGAHNWRIATARQARRAEASRKAAVRAQLFAEIQPVHVTNCELKRFGEPHDGGYPLCVNLLGAVKVGYSYGISGYDGWGCDIARQLHVTVHQYDCFDLREPPCPGGSTVFHGECIGTRKATEAGRPFDALGSQFARNGDDAVPIVMKIDVEGAEWESFLAAPDSVLAHVDELDVEFHHVDEARYVAAMQRLKRLFYIAHVHYNNFSCDEALAPFPSWAFEVLLVNKRVAMSDGSPAPVTNSVVDAANNPESQDCQVVPRGAL